MDPFTCLALLFNAFVRVGLSCVELSGAFGPDRAGIVEMLPASFFLLPFPLRGGLPGEV